MKVVSIVGALTLLAMSCGQTWSGKVSGIDLDPKDAVFASVSVDGAPAGVVVAVGSDSDLCTRLVSSFSRGNTQPPSLTYAMFSLVSMANGRQLAPSTGSYPISVGPTTGGNGRFASGTFTHTDEFGTLAIPAANTIAISGLFEIETLSSQTLKAHFDGRFGQQNDEVVASFTARNCLALGTTLAANKSRVGTSTLAACEAYKGQLSCIDTSTIDCGLYSTSGCDLSSYFSCLSSAYSCSFGSLQTNQSKLQQCASLQQCR